MSTVVVSALIPVLELLPGGNDGSVWASVTVSVPSGSPIRIRDLFSEPSEGLEALAIATRRKALSTNSCIRQSLRDPLLGDDVMRGFAPTVSNYRHFALTPRGLVIGFPLGQVGGPPCGAIEVTAPYGVLRPHLSTLGLKLITGVRQPRR